MMLEPELVPIEPASGVETTEAALFWKRSGINKLLSCPCRDEVCKKTDLDSSFN
jgi:hypothetical protein